MFLPCFAALPLCESTQVFRREIRLSLAARPSVLSGGLLSTRHPVQLGSLTSGTRGGCRASREIIRRIEQGSITPNLITFGKVADGLRMSLRLYSPRR